MEQRELLVIASKKPGEKFLLLDLIQDIQLATHIRAYVSLVNVISLKLLHPKMLL